MKRLFDLILCFIVITVFAIPCLLISILIRINSKGPTLYWSERIGRDNSIFLMPKFRTMDIKTPEVASHLLGDVESYYTGIGHFLRKTSLDEIPQVYSVLINEMSFVGPRPALFNQDDLIKLRQNKGVSSLKPGITGWAQVNGRDDLSIKEKVNYDFEYLNKQSFAFDIYIIWLTLVGVIKKDGVSH